MRFAHVILVLVGIAACSPDTTDVLAQPLVDGGTLADRADHAAFNAVLLIRPGDAFTCGNHISRWMEWGRKKPGQFLLVFDRPPTEDEQKQLTLLRVRPDAVLAKSRARSRPSGPYEYIIQDNHIIASHRVEPGTPETQLLKTVEQGRVAELLQGRV
jgi:hypothetical protein